VTSNEFYFLILVCGAFAALGIGLAIATILYRRLPPDAARVKHASTYAHGR
jgi:hypothetical protein